MGNRSIPQELAIDCRRAELRASAYDPADGRAPLHQETDLQKHGVIE
jgi:hypothetical protein